MERGIVGKLNMILEQGDCRDSQHNVRHHKHLQKDDVESARRREALDPLGSTHVVGKLADPAVGQCCRDAEEDACQNAEAEPVFIGPVIRVLVKVDQVGSVSDSMNKDLHDDQASDPSVIEHARIERTTGQKAYEVVPSAHKKEQR